MRHCRRGHSPPGVSPRAVPPLSPLTPHEPLGGSPRGPAAAAPPPPRSTALRDALLVACTALAALAAAVLLAPAALSTMLGMAQGGGGAAPSVNHTQIAAGCAHIDALASFNMTRCRPARVKWHL